MNIFVALDLDLQTAFQKAYDRVHVLNLHNGVTTDLPAQSNSHITFTNLIDENSILLLFLNNNNKNPLTPMNSFWNNTE